MDIKDAKAVEESVNLVVKELNGRLDIMVANSGIPWKQGSMVDSQLDHYHNVVKTDLDGTFYCAKAAAAHWRRQKEDGTDINGNKLLGFTYGSFIATASMSGHIVNIPQLQAAYNAAKAGVVHLCMFIHTGGDIQLMKYLSPQASLSLLNGFGLLAPTLFLLVIWQPRSPSSVQRKLKTSGRTRSPWAGKVRRMSSRVLTFTLPRTLLAILRVPTL